MMTGVDFSSKTISSSELALMELKNIMITIGLIRGGNGTFDKVINAVHLLKKHGVDFNLLTTVNSQNSAHP